MAKIDAHVRKDSSPQVASAHLGMGSPGQPPMDDPDPAQTADQVTKTAQGRMAQDLHTAARARMVQEAHAPTVQGHHSANARMAAAQEAPEVQVPPWAAEAQVARQDRAHPVAR